VTGSIVSARTRQRVRDLAVPVAMALGRLGLSPNALTVIGFVGTCVAAFFASEQAWLLAGVLVLVFGIFDLFDGALARATGRASKLGAFLDSTFDRAGEAATYVGIALGCVYVPFRLGAILAAAALGASQLVPYVRAKAESLGFAPGSGLMNVGLAPREVRLAILGLTLIATDLAGGLDIRFDQATSDWPWLGTHDCSAILAGGLGLITILATLTVIQRVLHVRAQAREG